MLWRALRGRCPYCGSRAIWARWGQLTAQCPGCAHHFEHEEGYFVGAMIVNLGLAEALFGVVLIGGLALTWPDVPWVPLTVVSVLLMIGLPILLYPRSKTLWLWLDYRVHPYRDEERPVVE